MSYTAADDMFITSTDSLSILTAISAGELRLPGFTGAKKLVVTTGAIRRAKLQSNRHHQQNNIQLFTGRMPFLSPNQQCRSTEYRLMIYLTAL